MNDHLTDKEREIAERHGPGGSEWMTDCQGVILGEIEVCVLCRQSWPCDTVQFAEALNDAQGKLAAARALIDDEDNPFGHDVDFRPHYPDPDFECRRCRLESILHESGVKP